MRAHLRVHHLGEVFITQTREDVLGRTRATLFELGDVAFVLSLFGEERFERFQLRRVSLLHGTSGHGTTPGVRVARALGDLNAQSITR